MKLPTWNDVRAGLTPGLLHIIAGSFCFSLMTVMVKLSGNYFPSQQIVFFRSLFVFFLSLGFLLHSRVSPWGNNRWLLILRGTTGFIALSCFFFAMTRLPLAEVVLIGFTRPIYLIILAGIFLGEPLRRNEILAAAVSLLGIVFIYEPAFLFGGSGSGLDTAGVVFAMLGAIFSAIAHLAIRGLRDSDHTYVVIMYFAMIALPGSVPLLLFAQGVVWPQGIQWVLLVAVGVFAMLGQINLTKGLSLERAGRAATVSYLGIVFAFLWGMLIFGEFPSLFGLFGATLIVGSVLTVATRKEKASAPAPKPSPQVEPETTFTEQEIHRELVGCGDEK